MNTIEAITEILKREGVQYLPCFPTTPVIEAAALGGIRPIVCRQERVGVGIADGLSRVTNGDHMGVFAMQYGPGAENAYPGIASAYSDSSPLLLLPLGHPRAASSSSGRISPEIRLAGGISEMDVPEQVRAIRFTMDNAFGPDNLTIPMGL